MTIAPKSEDKYVKKWLTARSFIRTEMSTYRIGTLVVQTELRERPLMTCIREGRGVQDSPQYWALEKVKFLKVVADPLFFREKNYKGLLFYQ